MRAPWFDRTFRQIAVFPKTRCEDTAPRAPRIALLVPVLMFGTAFARGAQAPCVLNTFKPPASSGHERFGSSVALSQDGRYALIGAPDLDTAGENWGAAYLYHLPLNGPVDGVKLVPADLQTYDSFGYSVAIDGSTAAVGAPDQSGTGTNKGAVYVWERQADTWVQSAKLATPASAPTGTHFSFGYSLSVLGNRLVVGEASGLGNVYVYERDPGGWMHKATLPNPETFGKSFAWSVDQDSERIIVGAPGYWTGVPGRAYVYRYDAMPATNWVLEDTLVSTSSHDNSFGTAVAIEGAHSIVATPLVGSIPFTLSPSTGSVDFFERRGGSWTGTQSIVAPEPLAASYFGYAVDLDSGWAVVGRDGQSGSKAYFLRDSGSGWTIEAKLENPWEPGTTGLGRAVAARGGRWIVGADFGSAGGAQIGEAFLGELNLHDLTTAALHGTPSRISLASGGEQVLTITPCGMHAGDVYLVLGSVSGTWPGLVAAHQSLFLNPDAYTAWTLAHPEAPPLSKGAGVLGVGASVAGVKVPANSPGALAGITLHHAYVVLSPQGGYALKRTSNPVALELVP